MHTGDGADDLAARSRTGFGGEGEIESTFRQGRIARGAERFVKLAAHQRASFATAWYMETFPAG